MKYADFREQEIKRTCDKKYKSFSSYRSYLKRDFHDRCCYCNMPGNLITSPYHVDHFIPFNEFKGKKDFLLTDYENLMWTCPKCNVCKSDQYQGDLMNTPEIVNELFYNPVTVDYNKIFYRNEYGGIDSDDEKGREMIKRLKLYRPIHNLAWLVERLETVMDKLDAKIARETEEKKREALEGIRNRFAYIHAQKERAFRAAYNEKIFPSQKEDK